jgi:hypothetical protein
MPKASLQTVEGSSERRFISVIATCLKQANFLGTNVIKAVAIFLRNSPPRDISVREKIRLAKIFGTNVYTKHGARGNNSDFGQFVRKIYA